ncbi:MAG: S1 RNA-binding domain-containing protein [Lachnospiraceae bacterium]|nr:S1 RNA-binding domain-containing protein [Lachnospiraceae bacterium]
MFKLGNIQTLTVVKKSPHGVYLETMDNDDTSPSVLLPTNQVTDSMLPGSLVDAFIYRDSDDRLIATTTVPKLIMGQFALLTVKEVNDIGAFLDWGLAKDLFLPYKEQKRELTAGDKVFVTLYIDKSGRLCATTRVYDLLYNNHSYTTGDTVSGTVFDINPRLGAFVAIDDKYLGLLPTHLSDTQLEIGSTITATVDEVREDGKITLKIRERAHIQMDADAALILDKLQENEGFLPYHDKSSAQEIMDYFGFSKNAFKRAIGRLYKEHKIVIEEDGIKTL